MGQNLFTFFVVIEVLDVNFKEIGQLNDSLGNLSFEGIPVIKKSFHRWIHFLTESNYSSNIRKDDSILFWGNEASLVERNLDLIDDKLETINVYFLCNDPLLDSFLAIICLPEEVFLEFGGLEYFYVLDDL